MAVNPTRPKGPPLNSLRAFEAAARHPSFVLAAQELGVSPGAVSQHIKTLEAWTGGALFTRRANDVRLTETGQQLAPGFTAAFDELGNAIRALRNARPERHIHIATMPGIAQLWLPARLSAFRAATSDVRLSVTALERPPNLRRELFDLSIFITEPDPDEMEITIAEDVIYPVCAPEIAQKINSTNDLFSLPRLLDQSWQDDWQIWAMSAGLSLADATATERYSLYGLAIQETLAGAGVLMGHDCLVREHVKAGRLVAAHEHQCKTGKILSLRLQKESRKRHEIRDMLTLLTGFQSGSGGGT